MTLQHNTRTGYPLQINHLNIFHCQHTKPKMNSKKSRKIHDKKSKETQNL